jgi:pSer/pThr/pTyr-binding forkhead associated (FHA) protein
LTVEDSGSTNGTYVNDERVDSIELSPGDEVLVGRFHFVVARGDD